MAARGVSTEWSIYNTSAKILVNKNTNNNNNNNNDNNNIGNNNMNTINDNPDVITINNQPPFNSNREPDVIVGVLLNQLS